MKIKDKLEDLYLNTTTTFPLNKSETMILALCFKSGKRSRAIAKLLKISLQTVRNYISNLKNFGLIRSSSIKGKRHERYYIFDGTKEQLKKCPAELVEYVKEYWKENKK